MGLPQKKSMLTARLEAKRLYIYEGLSGKEIAEKVGVSANSVSKWVGLYGWKNERERVVNALLGSEKHQNTSNVLEDFMSYLKSSSPQLYKSIQEQVNNFKNLTTKHHDTSN